MISIILNVYNGEKYIKESKEEKINAAVKAFKNA